MKIKPDGADFIVLDDRERRLAWERGQADYMGADSFENIRRKLDQKMAPSPPPSKVESATSPLSQLSLPLSRLLQHL
nr:hypothetical protein BaRGS_028828 [Batillaria attramentaria]KAG5697985.1 hypothetical protein BaRGS_005803 [Batillaria attramentaria]